MAYDEEFALRVALAFERAGAIYETKEMMGGLCFLVDDKMAIAIIKDELMVRLAPERTEELLNSNPTCRPMDFTGKTPKGYLYVEGPDKDHTLDFWLKEALAFNPHAKRSKKR